MAKYAVISPNLTAVSIGGVSTAPTNVPSFPNFVLGPDPAQWLEGANNSLYATGGFTRYPTDLVARANGEGSSFTIDQAGEVGFAITDYPNMLSDNVGGVSLRISSDDGMMTTSSDNTMTNSTMAQQTSVN